MADVQMCKCKELVSIFNFGAGITGSFRMGDAEILVINT